MVEQVKNPSQLPLAGKRIAITRHRAQAGTLRDALARLGAQVNEIPAIEIADPPSWEPLDNALRRLKEFQYLLFTSPNGVRSFLRRLKACGRTVRDVQGLRIGAIGPGTARELTQAGVAVDFVPREYRAEGLLEALGDAAVRGQAFLIPRARVARDLVPKALAARGARVEVVVAYETLMPQFSPGEFETLLTPPPDLITFTSSSTATHFARLCGDLAIGSVLARVAVASIGPITSETLRKLGLRVAIEAAESTIPGLVKAIEQYFGSRAPKAGSGSSMK